MSDGILYIAATPIGNLQDISFRLIDVLQKVDAIACEDTRKTGILLKHINSLSLNNIDPNKKYWLISYYEQNEKIRIPGIINLLKNGKNVALVSDAGTPTISDPGFKLVRECIREGIKVESIPGASAVTLALTVSGLPTDKFLFVGYPPKKPGKRKKSFENIKQSLQFLKTTVIFYESPHRITKTLKDLQEVFGDIEIVVCRELTKIHEEIRREKISDSLSHFEKNPAKGEMTILFNPEVNTPLK